eukprot:503381-Alexandrium_andersonii.AAC.1
MSQVNGDWRGQAPMSARADGPEGNSGEKDARSPASPPSGESRADLPRLFSRLGRPSSPGAHGCCHQPFD